VLDRLLDGVSLAADGEAVGDDDQLGVLGTVPRVEDGSQELPEHPGVEPLRRVQVRVRVALLDDEALDVEGVEACGDDSEDEVPDGLAVLGGVEVLQANAPLDEVVLQDCEGLIPFERPRLGDRGEGEVPCAGRREVEVAPFVQEEVEMPG